MAAAGNASGRWLQLDATRRGFIRRCEIYASYTLPKLCLPDGYDQNNSELSHDFQAVGAQAVNHLANKIMLAGFAPSRPFFVMDATPAVQSEIDALGVDATEVSAMLAKGEKAAVKELDRLALRPKLYEVIKHLVVIGNVLLCLEDDTARVIGIKKYAVRRSASGQILEIMIIDKVLFDELDPAVQDTVSAYANFPGDREVTLYKWIKRNKRGDFLMEQWVDTYKLPKEFNGKWPEDKLPYRVLTWDLSDDAHYGTGLVEDYKGDFAGLSTLSKSQVIGAVLASEFRWLVNPAGLTSVDDFASSENGAAIPGSDGDITLIESSKSHDLQLTLNMSAEYVTRIGRGFLLGSTMVRQAERVTQEEIRLIANELETSLGGAYSRIAVDLQRPMARWLMARVGIGVDGSGFDITIVTGLEALSRTGDLENLKLWLADMAAISALPPNLQATLKMRPLAQAFAAPRRVDVSAYLKSDEEIAADQAAARKAEQETMAAQAGANIAENVASQPQGQPA
jgi:hypothetical protein